MAETAENGTLTEDMEARVRTRALVFACAVGVAAALATPAQAADKLEDLAQAAAESWLKLTDAGDAVGSWDQARRSRGRPTGST